LFHSIIATTNTGAADIVKDGEAGWILPVADRQALEERLSWCLTHREKLAAMRDAARAVAEMYT